jgi:hypothetical protein
MSPGRWEPVIFPTWISELAYGQAMAIRIFSVMSSSNPLSIDIFLVEGKKLPALASSIIIRH